MPRATSLRVSTAWSAMPAASASRSATIFALSRVAIVRARPSLTLSATSSCCAPSWRSRSRACRARSCATSMRWRDVRSSSSRSPSRDRSRVLARSMDAWPARSSRSRWSAELAPSPGRLVRLSAPTSWPSCRTGCMRTPGRSGTSSPFNLTGSGAPAASPAIARGTSTPPSATQTTDSAAPVPSASSRAASGSADPASADAPMRPVMAASASYGVARWPYTSRFAQCWTRTRTGSNATATSAVAAMASPRFPSPIGSRRPSPTTTAA